MNEDSFESYEQGATGSTTKSPPASLAPTHQQTPVELPIKQVLPVQLNPTGLTTALQLYPLAKLPFLSSRSMPVTVILLQGAAALHCKLAMGSAVSVPRAWENSMSEIEKREELQLPATPLKVVHCVMLKGRVTDVRLKDVRLAFLI